MFLNLHTKSAINRYHVHKKMNLSFQKHDNLYFNIMLAFTLFPKFSNSCMNHESYLQAVLKRL